MKTRFACVAAAVILLPLMVAPRAPAEPADRALQLDAAIEQALEQAVVYVAVEYSKPNSTRQFVESGTGFFVTRTHVITNHHVVSAALSGNKARLTVRLFSGTRAARLCPAKVVRSDSGADLALLSVEGDLPPIAPVRLHDQLPGKQAEVFAFGFPLGTMLDRSLNGPNVCLRRGYVSRLINDGKNIESDLNIDKGISGGPLVDRDGVVRGVVRAMAGSDFNKGFAAISVASPVLLEFCQASGIAVTLADGRTLEPKTHTGVASPGPTDSTPASTDGTPTKRPIEQAPRPRVGLAEDELRAFFALGCALRLSSLVPGILVVEKADYTADLRQTSKSNAELVLANLQKVKAPAALLQQARALSVLLGDAQTQPAVARDKSTALEGACDTWSRDASEDERLNYDLGSWLTELSLGVLDPEKHKDSRYCAYFLDQARRADAAAAVIDILSRLQSGLQDFEQSKSEDTRQRISKEADRLIGIGVIAGPTNPDPIEKTPTEPPGDSTPRNRIRYPL